MTFFTFIACNFFPNTEEEKGCFGRRLCHGITALVFVTNANRRGKGNKLKSLFSKVRETTMNRKKSFKLYLKHENRKLYFVKC